MTTATALRTQGQHHHPGLPTDSPSPGRGESVVAQETLKLLFANSAIGLTVSLTFAAVLVTTHWSWVSHHVLLAWWSGMTLLTVARALLVAQFKKALTGTSASTWFTRHLVGVALSGIGWGAAGLLLFTPDSVEHQALLSLILAGMTAGAVPIFSASRRTFLAFALPACLPIIAKVLLIGDQIHVAIGITGLIFLGIMTGLVWAINRELVRNIELSALRTQAEAELLDVFEHTHDLIQRVAPDGRLLFVNRAWRETLGYTATEIDSLNIFDVLHPNDHEPCRHILHGITDGNDEGAVGMTFRTKSGRTVITEGRMRLRVEAGRPIAALGIFRDITKRTIAEARLHAANQKLEHLVDERTSTLRERERLFRTLAECSPEGIFQTDAAGQCLYVNDRWCDIAGMSPDTAKGIGWIAAIHPDDRERIATEWAEAAQDRQPFRSEYRFQRTDGRITWVMGQARAEIDEQGNVASYVGTITDITERKQAEKALPFLSADVAHLTGDAFFGEVAVQIARLLQMDVGFVGKLLPTETARIRAIGLAIDGQLQPPLEYDLANTPCEQVLGKHATAFPEDVQRIFPHDRMLADLKITSYAAVPLFDMNGRPIGHVGVMGRKPLYDIQQAENILQLFAVRAAAEMERQRTEAKFHDLFEFSPDAVLMVNHEGLITMANRQAETLFGYTRVEFFGLPVERLMPESTQPGQVELREQFTGTTTPRMMGTGRSELRALKKDGTVFPIDLSLNPIQTEEGLLMVAAIRDITQRKEAETALQTSQDEIRQMHKMEALGQLAGGIAHDFNNILTAILGNAEIALLKSEDDHPSRPNLSRILEAGQRASHVVQQILTFTRQQDVSRTVLPLAPVVTEAFALLRATLPAGIELTSACDAATPQVLANATQLQQVLMNLCTNAWHALGDKPGRIAIDLAPVTLAQPLSSPHATLPPGRYARLSVSDTGCGMPPETVARIFDPFFTTKPLGQGTGLGLSVVHGIVQGHDGAITVESMPGQGTTIYLYFPAVKTPDPASDPAEAAGAPAPRRPCRLLYLDDEEMLVELVRALFEPLGYRVTGCTKPSEALAAIRADPEGFDVVVTDYNMPELSGLEVAREVAKIREALPMVLVSGYLTPADQTTALAANIKETVYKPTMLQELGKVLTRLLDNHPAE